MNEKIVGLEIQKVDVSVDPNDPSVVMVKILANKVVTAEKIVVTIVVPPEIESQLPA